MKKRLVVFAISCLVLAGCSQEKADKGQVNTALTQGLLGEWRNVYLRLTMNSYKDSDSSRVFEVNEANWEAKMNIQPIRTFFRKDGTYNSEHRNLADSMVYNPAGRWVVYGDTIVMTDTFPSIGQAYRYKVILKDSLVEFYGMEDSDRDGKNDDNYFGIQRRQKP